MQLELSATGFIVIVSGERPRPSVESSNQARRKRKQGTDEDRNEKKKKKIDAQSEILSGVALSFFFLRLASKCSFCFFLSPSVSSAVLDARAESKARTSSKGFSLLFFFSCVEKKKKKSENQRKEKNGVFFSLAVEEKMKKEKNLTLRILFFSLFSLFSFFFFPFFVVVGTRADRQKKKTAACPLWNSEFCFLFLVSMAPAGTRDSSQAKRARRELSINERKRALVV